MTENKSSAAAKVVVLSEDVVVGRALELLLRTTDYDVKFLADPSSLNVPGLFDEVELLLLAPVSDTERREALLEIARNAPATAKVSVLELVTDAWEVRAGPGNYVSWPCRSEALKRQVDALLAGFEADGACSAQQAQENHTR